MKYTKKIAAAVLMLMLVLALAVPTFAKSKAKKPKLSKTKVTMYVRDRKTITLKNAKASKVKWFTSNKSVATVKKGKITAKKKGTAYIKAKNKGKTYKCKVTVKVERIPVTSPNYIFRELQNYVDANGDFKKGVVTPAPITQTSLYDGREMKTDPKRDTSTVYILWKGKITKNITAFIYTSYPLTKVNGKWYVTATNSTSYGTPIEVKMVDTIEGDCGHVGVLNYVSSNPEVEVLNTANSLITVYAMNRYNCEYHVNPGQTFTVTVKWRGITVELPFYVPVV